MTILDKIEVKETMNKRPYQNRMSFANVVETGEIYENGLATQKEYQLKLQVGCNFWANQAQYNNARKKAEKVLLHTLYGEILAKLDLAIHAIYNRDEQTALDQIFSIREELIK